MFSQQVSNLQYEMLLLTDSISKEGGCWELRLRCGKPDFLTSIHKKVVVFFTVRLQISFMGMIF